MAGKKVSTAMATIALTLAIGGAGVGYAQVQQIQMGRGMDANPGIGTGGSNRPIQGYVPINGNEIISGNVSGLKYFHDRTSSFSPYQFQGSLGSARLTNFARQSAGSDVNPTPLNQVYYLPSTTVSTGQGALYTSPMGGGFDSQLLPRSSISPTASAAQVNSLVPREGSSQYRALDRVEAGRSEVEAGTEGALMSAQLFGLRVPAIQQLNAVQQEQQAARLRQESTPGRGGIRAPGAEEADDATAQGPTPYDRWDTLMTGRRDARLVVRSEADRVAPLPKRAKAEDARVSTRYRTLLDDLRTAEKAGGGGGTAATASAAGAGGAGADIDPLTGRPRRPALLSSAAGGRAGAAGGTATTAPALKPGAESAAPPATRIEQVPLSTLLAGSKVAPLKTLVQGQGPGGAGATPAEQQMARAEALLKEAKYMEAADAYHRAITLDPGNVLALVGRAHAELGAGMYQAAAYDLKFVFTRNPQMVGVKYDMDTFMPGARQEYLMKDLSALTSLKDMGNTASFLVAYLFYQTGRGQQLQVELQKWGARPDHDTWQVALARAWNPGNREQP
jgi:hypothetical protein